MSRPLQSKSIVELKGVAERNRGRKAELELIRVELMHRSTQAAFKLRKQVENWIAACDELPTLANNSSGSSGPYYRISPKMPRHPQVKEWTYAAVGKLRAKLIDLSRRSSLIAFNHSSRSASQLRVVDERPDLLFHALHQGAMGFEPLPGEESTPADERTPEFGIAYERARLTDPEFLAATEKLGQAESDARAWHDAERSLRARVRAQLGLPKLDYGKSLDLAALARAHGFDPSYDLKESDDGDVAEHHEDDSIRVLLMRKELDRRLKSIDDRATSHLRETGHHTLHLVFGFVQWFEDDQSDVPFHAPLLLLPVRLAKDEGRAKKEYRLNVWEGGLEVNVALIEKAREHWGLQIPALRENETPESYFIRIRPLLAQGSRLTLRTFVTLSVLPPMILWRDLDPDKWPDDAFAEHRLLPGLLGAAEISSVDGDDTLIDIDDPSAEARVPALITDADASQHRAIMDMAAGRDMAIEGPPGTGKSQTITNMIATALSQGKRVLFVAEKQAALRVVSDRLRVAGFGPLLLELHGDKASRADVYAGIRERLDAKPKIDSAALSEKRSELRRHRELLRRYLALVRAPLGRSGRTAHALAWREIRLRRLFNPTQILNMSARWALPKPAELSAAELTENREVLAQFGQALIAVDRDRGGERTRWVLASRLDPFDQTRALAAAADCAGAARTMAQLAARYRQLGVNLPLPTEGSIGQRAKELSQLRPFGCDDERIVRAALNCRSACEELVAAQSRWESQRQALTGDVAQPETVPETVVRELGEALGLDRCPRTLEEVAEDLRLNQRLRAALGSAGRDIERLSSRLTEGSRSSVGAASVVASTFARLQQIAPEVGALLSSTLLDPASESVMAASAREAETLLAERDVVAQLVQADAFSADPSELDDLAETIEGAGPISRLFSGRYKATWRRAARFCNDTLERSAVVSALRRTAGYLRSARAFMDGAKARALFPPMVWDGIASDFTSLATARVVLADANSRLAAVDELSVLRWWLGLDTTERQTFSSAAERISVMLAEFNEAGFGDVLLAELANRCALQISSLQRLDNAARAVGLSGGALFWRDGARSVSDTILELHASRRDFDVIRSHPEFSWVGEVDAPLQALVATLSEAAEVCATPCSTEILALLASTGSPAALLASICESAPALAAAVQEWERASENLSDVSELNLRDLCEGADWEAAFSVLTELCEDREGASLAADLLKYRAAVAARGLAAFADAATSGLVCPERLDDMYELLATSALMQSYLGGDGQELGVLGGLSLDAARRAFKKVDKELHKLEAAAIVAARLKDQPPIGVGYGRKADFTELRLLEHEVELTRPRTALRDVMHRAGGALQALKPVWMMSPTSIAQFIRPGSITFDLLIIDEASQMRPEFSVSCILRADQFVVVGDANQLPPSDHFQVASVEGGDNEGDDVGVDEGTESILDLANQRFRTKPRLKWHYRSQHESLIQFSNRQFYQRDLVVFPSPMANDDELLGVKCLYVPAFHADTVYEASINQREAELVIEQAFALMQTHPELSIGIVAMNAKQTELIQNEFDRLIVEEERVQKYVEAFKGTIDEFFIKNLENVQGDERDVILISTVYGPDKNGVVRQNFGLMNREVGWRRLNVLVTRAKMSCRLITSLRPDDIKVTEKSSRGVIAFKSYLTYAHGGAHYEDASGGETDSDFEIFVADALRDAGYQVVYQVGVENFRIDLGVRHQSCPVGFIAGIECDGAPYHSGLSVRDRDHIRQTILENLGWNIYRVWSTDWFANPARETAKLLAWLDAVRDQLVRDLDKTPEPIAIRKPAKAPVNAVAVDTIETDLVAQESDPAIDSGSVEVAAVAARLEPRQPRGRLLRSLGDFQTYEAVRGKLYEVWQDDVFLGEVEVVKRATAAPKLYGDRVLTAQSEYEGRVEANDDCFTSFDLFAAMREVAKRALVH